MVLSLKVDSQVVNLRANHKVVQLKEDLVVLSLRVDSQVVNLRANRQAVRVAHKVVRAAHQALRVAHQAPRVANQVEVKGHHPVLLKADQRKVDLRKADHPKKVPEFDS